MTRPPTSCFFKGSSRRMSISNRGTRKASVLPEPVHAFGGVLGIVEGGGREPVVGGVQPQRLRPCGRGRGGWCWPARESSG